MPGLGGAPLTRSLAKSDALLPGVSAKLSLPAVSCAGSAISGTGRPTNLLAQSAALTPLLFKEKKPEASAVPLAAASQGNP